MPPKISGTSPVTPPAAISAPVRSAESLKQIYLEKEAKGRLIDFFKEGRPYRYKAAVQVPSKKSVEVKFDLILTDFLKEFVDALRDKGISVHGVYLKGGAVQQILVGNMLKLSDLDLTIKIDETADEATFRQIDEILLSILEKKGKLGAFSVPGTNTTTYMQDGKRLSTEWGDVKRILSFRGGRLNRKYVSDNHNQFAIHTLPTHFLGYPQELDLQVTAKVKKSCFTSSDAIVINLLPYLDSKGTIDDLQIPLEAVDGYDVNQCLKLIRQKTFDVQPRSGVADIKDGLRGYCRILSRGYQPIDTQIEKLFAERFLFEHRPINCTKLSNELSDYLERHYSQDFQGKIIYLLNYYGILQRAFNVDEKHQLEEMILGLIFKNLREDRGEYTDIQARDFIRLAQSFLFLRSVQPGPVIEDVAFFIVKRGHSEVLGNNHLFFSSPVSLLAELRNHLGSSVTGNKLLDRLAEYFPHDHHSNLLEFFEVKLAQFPEPKKPISFIEAFLENNRGGLRAGEIDRVKENIFRFDVKVLNRLSSDEKKDLSELTKDTLFALLESEKLSAVEILTERSLELGILDSTVDVQFLTEIFRKLSSPKRTFKLLKAIVSKNQPIVCFLSSVTSHIKNDAEMKQLVGIVSVSHQKGQIDFSEYSKEVLLFCSEVLTSYPECLPDLLPLVESAPADMQGVLLLDCSAKTKDKKKILDLFITLYQKRGVDLFLNHEECLNLELVKLFLPELFKIKPSPKVGLEFYQWLEPHISEEQYPEVYLLFLSSIRSLKEIKSFETVLLQGLNRINAASQLDENCIAALTIFQNHVDLYRGSALITERLSEILRDSEDLALKQLKKSVSELDKKPESKKSKKLAASPEELFKQAKNRIISPQSTVKDIHDFFSLDTNLLLLHKSDFSDALRSAVERISGVKLSDEEAQNREAIEKTVKSLDALSDLIQKKFASLMKIEDKHSLLTPYLISFAFLFFPIGIKKGELEPTKEVKEFPRAMEAIKRLFEEKEFNLDSEEQISFWGDRINLFCKTSQGLLSLWNGLNDLEKQQKCRPTVTRKLFLISCNKAVAALRNESDENGIKSNAQLTSKQREQKFKIFMNFIAEMFKRNFGIKEDVASNFWPEHLFSFLLCSEGQSVLLKGLKSLETENESFSVQIYSVRLAALFAGISLLKKDHVSGLNTTCQLLSDLTNYLNKFPESVSDTLWIYALDQGTLLLSEVARILFNLRKSSGISEVQKKLVFDTVNRLVCCSGVYTSQDLEFDLGHLRGAVSFLRDVNDPVLFPSCERFFGGLETLFYPNQELLKIGSCEDLIQAGSKVHRISVARDYLRAALSKDPGNPVVLVKLGELAQKGGEVLLASRYYLDVVHSTHPQVNDEFRNIAANACYAMKQWSDAQTCYQQVIAKNIEVAPIVYCYLSCCYAELQDAGSACRYGELFVEKSGRNLASLIYLSKLCWKLAQEENATLLDYALELADEATFSFEDNLEAWTHLGELETQVLKILAKRQVSENEIVEQSVKMLEIYLKCNKLQPNNPSFLGRCGELYYQVGDYEKSLAFARQAHALEPETIRYLDIIFVACDELQMIDQSIEVLSQIIELRMGSMDPVQGPNGSLIDNYLYRMAHYQLRGVDETDLQKCRDDFEFLKKWVPSNPFIKNHELYQQAKRYLAQKTSLKDHF